MGLNLLNSPLAWGAVAFCVPLILHILNRSRFRRVEWGAMHLLDSVVKVNHRRFQLEQLLLLLVRCLIPAILAFTLARPVLTGAAAPAGNTPTSLVVVLDNSYSMQADAGPRAAAGSGSPGSAADRAADSRFAAAVEAATAIIESLPRGSDVAVIQSGGAARSLLDTPVFDTQAVCRKLRALDADMGPSQFRDSLNLALTTLAGMNHTRRELVVISDFQTADWNDGTLAASVAEQSATMAFEPAVSLISVGSSVSGNVAVESVEIPQRPIGRGQPFLVRAELRNRSDQTINQIRAFVDVDGEPLTASDLSLAARSTSQVTFPVQIEQPGSHVIRVRLESADALAADNQTSVALTIRDSLDVLLVDGDPVSEPLQSETDFLSIALTPFRYGRMRLSDLISTRTAKHTDNLKPLFEASPGVIVLANVPRLTEAQANALTRYVEGGGAVLMTSGSRVDVDWYNTRLHDQRDLLPARLGRLQTVADDSEGLLLQSQRFDHPALQYFNDPAHGDLSAARFRKWFQLENSATESTSRSTPAAYLTTRLTTPLNAALQAEEGSATTSPIAATRSTVLARLANGDPLLLERTQGDGVVLLLTTSCDDDWNSLPLQPVYVPLMQQLIATMATRLTPPQNVSTGDRAVSFLAAPENANSTDDATAAARGESLSLTVTTPAGTRQQITAPRRGQHYVVEYANTLQPGVYELSAADLPTSHFVATTSRAESELTSLSAERLQTLANDMQAGVVADANDYLAQDRLRRNGWEIWKLALMALLAFLFLELLLQQRFGRVRP